MQTKKCNFLLQIFFWPLINWVVSLHRPDVLSVSPMQALLKETKQSPALLDSHKEYDKLQEVWGQNW